MRESQKLARHLVINGAERGELETGLKVEGSRDGSSRGLTREEFIARARRAWESEEGPCQSSPFHCEVKGMVISIPSIVRCSALSVHIH